MKALIIEDFEPVALGIQKALNDRGHECDCIIGVRSFQPFIGISLDKQDIATDPSQYDVVFSDGELYGPHMGTAVVQDLAARGIVCIAISSQESFNDKMVANGATAGFWKISALAALVEGDLTIENCTNLVPDVIATVVAYKDRLNQDLSLRGKIESIIMSR